MRKSLGRNTRFSEGAWCVVELLPASRGGGSPSEATYGYTGTVIVDGRRVTSQTARGSGPLTFDGQVAPSGELNVVVPLLVPTADEVSVSYRPT